MAKDAGLDLYSLPFEDARPQRLEWLAKQPTHPPMVLPSVHVASKAPLSIRMRLLSRSHGLPGQPVHPPPWRAAAFAVKPRCGTTDGCCAVPCARLDAGRVRLTHITCKTGLKARADNVSCGTCNAGKGPGGQLAADEEPREAGGQQEAAAGLTLHHRWQGRRYAGSGVRGGVHKRCDCYSLKRYHDAVQGSINAACSLRHQGVVHLGFVNTSLDCK